MDADRQPPTGSGLTRREFLPGAAAGAAGLSLDPLGTGRAGDDRERVLAQVAARHERTLVLLRADRAAVDELFYALA